MNNKHTQLKKLAYLSLGIMLTPSLSFCMEQDGKQDQPAEQAVQLEDYEDTSAGDPWENMVDYMAQLYGSQPQPEPKPQPKKAEKEDEPRFLGYGRFIEAVAQEVADDNPVSRVALILKTEKQRLALPNWVAREMEIAAIAAANARYRELLSEPQL
jgi:hypothetical protein